MSKCNRMDFVESDLFPALKSSQNDMLKSIGHYEAKFVESRSRLVEVRVEKAKKAERETFESRLLYSFSHFEHNSMHLSFFFNLFILSFIH
jgi:hypothetical protein